jgi:Tfp pilus assembly protein PilF
MRRNRTVCVLLVAGPIVLLSCGPLVRVTVATALQQPDHSRPQSKTAEAKAPGANESTKGIAPFEIRGVVTSVRGRPIPGAEVQVTLQRPEGRPVPLPNLETDIHGEFRAKLPLPPHSSRPWVAALEAGSDGLLDAHDWIELAPGKAERPVELVLQKPLEDAHLLPLDVLTDALASKLRAPSGAARLTGVDAQHYALALRFLDRNDPASAGPVLADVARRNPNCIECQILAGLTALQCGGWSSAASDFTRAAHLAGSTQGGGRAPEPFIALGVLDTWRGELPKAAVSFLQALALQPDNALALQEVGRVFVLQQKMATADGYLQRALAHGAGADAHLLRAQALLELEQPQKAQAELDAFLGGRKPKELSEGPRSLWTELLQRVSIESRGSASTILQRSPAELAAEFPELKGLAPASDQSQLESVLRKVGASVQALFQSFPDTSSHEEIEMEVLHPNGKVAESQAQRFQYLMVKTSDENGFHLSEYRTDKAGNRATPGSATDGTPYMVTLGFASDPLIFHPDYLAGSSLRLLGRQRLDGHDTLVIAFAERPATAKMLEEFRITNGSAVVLVQGIAWVDATTYQVLRMHTDLLRPVPELRLEAQATDVRFGEVRFPSKDQVLWLPQDVAVTVHWNGRTFRNRHRYSDYELFQVNTRQKIKAPKAQEPAE